MWLDGWRGGRGADSQLVFSKKNVPTVTPLTQELNQAICLTEETFLHATLENIE